MSGPDGLHVHAVPASTSYGCWARRWAVVGKDGAVLLATRRGALVGVYADPAALARDVDVAELRDA